MYLTFNPQGRALPGRASRSALPSSPWHRRPPTSIRSEATGGNGFVKLLAVIAGVCVLHHVLSANERRRKPLARSLRDEVSRRAGWECEYCGIRVTRRTRHIDHATSVANDGTNSIRNLRNACAPCNLAKGAMNRREFLRPMQ